MDNLGGYSAITYLECFESATMAKRHVGIRLREFAQHRIEPCLRADLLNHRAKWTRSLILSSGPLHSRQLVSAKIGYEHGIHRVIVGKRTVHHLVGDAPTAAELHSPDIHLVHLGRVNPPVRLLNEKTLDATPAQIGGEGEPDRSSADDQHGCFTHRNHSRFSLFVTKSCRKRDLT